MANEIKWEPTKEQQATIDMINSAGLVTEKGKEVKFYGKSEAVYNNFVAKYAEAAKAKLAEKAKAEKAPAEKAPWVPSKEQQAKIDLINSAELKTEKGRTVKFNGKEESYDKFVEKFEKAAIEKLAAEKAKAPAEKPAPEAEKAPVENAFTKLTPKQKGMVGAIQKWAKENNIKTVGKDGKEYALTFNSRSKNPIAAFNALVKKAEGLGWKKLETYKDKGMEK